MAASSIWYKLFVDKIISTLLILMLGIGGIFAFNSMVKENNPDLAIPTALISIEWPGAAAQQVEKEITKPLEDILNGMNGIKKLDSGSQFSFSLVAVEFAATLSIPEAMNQLRAKVDEAAAKFPSQAKRPKVEQLSINDTPVIEYMLYGDLDDYSLSQAVKKIAKKLENHPQVRKVEKIGYRETSVHVRLLPDRLRSLNISPLYVQNRIQQANRDMSWGEYDSGESVSELYYSGRFESIDSLKSLPIIRSADNRLIKLEEIALVYKGLDRAKTETYFSAASADYTKAISIGIKKNVGVDTVALVEDVKQMMVDMSNESFWPHGLKYASTSDESELIMESFSDIFNNIWQAMLAVFLVLLVLLTWREALIAGIAIPLTFIGTLFILWMTGSTLNTMVIIGMVLALGLLVDVFILVMEGMHEHIYVKKMPFSQAAYATVKTYAAPAFTGQLTTILAMSPMLFIGGTDGKFIRLLPLTGILCLIISYIVAFVIAIPLSQLLLKAKQEQAISKMDSYAQKISQKVSNWLLSAILVSKKRAMLLVAITGLVWLGSSFLFSTLPSLLYPKDDGRNLAITIRLSPDATLDQSREVAVLAGDYLKQQYIFENVTMYVGKRSPLAASSLKEQIAQNTSYNLIGFSALFVPKAEREKLAFEYVEELRNGLETTLAEVAGISITIKEETGGSSNDEPLQIVLTGDDPYKLAQYAVDVEQLIKQVPGVVDVRNNLGYFKSQWSLTADSEALNFHDITEADFAAQLRLATEADEVGKFKMSGIEDDLKIRLSTYWESRGDDIGGAKSFSELSLLGIFNAQSESVLLENLVEIEAVSIPSVYIHKGGKRAITVMGKVNGITVGEVIEQIDLDMQTMQAAWPANYSYTYGGEAESAGETYSSAGVALIFALILVFAVLTLSLGSFAQATVVLTTIPLALIGTFVGFWLLSLPFSFPAMIGLISLIGIVVNNAIVMLDTMNNHLSNGMSVKKAAAQGAAERLRPIFGTTITTLVGLIPLALSNAMWFPLCMAIIFGLLASTIIAIVVIPAMYILVTKMPAERSMSLQSS